MLWRYSSNVVAPMHCISPLAKAGFNMLAASRDPGDPPAPIMVWISSMNRIMSGLFSSSLIIELSLSSNCPRYFVPATMPAISKPTMRFRDNEGGALCCIILHARPSTIADFPTPGSPISTGLFFLRLLRICARRSISAVLPMTGSSLPSSASLV